MDDETLDPRDWEAFRATGHRMLDDMIDFLRDVRERPAWRPVTGEARQTLSAPLPEGPTPLDAIYDDFRGAILPFASGNIHPGFVGWVHGSGTPTGMLAELLAAGMNSNLGGREHAAIYVERQVIGWCRALFGFPEGASGLLVTGTSMANLIAVVVARTARLGPEVRARGLRDGPRLTAYAARSAHGCVVKAMEIAGLGADALRLLPVDAASISPPWRRPSPPIGATEPRRSWSSGRRAPSTPAPSTTSRASPRSPRRRASGSTSTGRSARSPG